VWAADNQTFITGALDRSRGLCQWNLSGEKIYDWATPHRVEDLTLSPNGQWLVAMDDRAHVHVYNYVTRELEYSLELRNRLTSVSISADSRFLLINQQNGVAELFDLISREEVLRYMGHTGGDFMLRSTFGGADESFVVSGSEGKCLEAQSRRQNHPQRLTRCADGFIYIWHKTTATLVKKLAGHQPRTNSITWSPTDPCLFASCGDDGKVKV
jgi:WD repeat-containing protein 26